MMDAELDQAILMGIGAVMGMTAMMWGLFRKRGARAAKSQTDAPVTLVTRDSAFGQSLKSFFSKQNLSDDDWLDLEQMLLEADVGMPVTQMLFDTCVKPFQHKGVSDVMAKLRDTLTSLLTPASAFTLESPARPKVIYIVGVNGVGKTTTIGKLAKFVQAQGKSVLLIAADTFRAAAADQLNIWAERNQVRCVSSQPGADPSSVIVDGLRAAQAEHIDVVLVDTAGRLNTKDNLMVEMQKMVRMCTKVLNKEPDDIWLVLDAITGQNGYNQARDFLKAVKLTGLVLTKYDATRKGGMILPVIKETGLPLRFLGMGERIEDLQVFDAQTFVANLLGSGKQL